ncbi:MAG: hypothetical protein ABI881_15995 [Betaproteobacteria bacterium]
MTIRTLADLYMAQYAGRDNTRVQRIGFWCAALGDSGSPILLTTSSTRWKISPRRAVATMPARMSMAAQFTG